jgi:hypothetical protein
VDALTSRVQRNELLFAVINIGNLPLHDIDESIAEGNVESNFIPDIREAIRLLALTDWGTEFQSTADEIREHAVAALQALDADDVEGAAEPAAALHEGWHDFADEVWAVLVADLPEDAGGVPPHEEEGDATPGASEDGAEEGDDHGEDDAAGATPAAEATP